MISIAAIMTYFSLILVAIAMVDNAPSKINPSLSPSFKSLLLLAFVVFLFLCP